MERSPNGQAIVTAHRTRSEKGRLRVLLARAKKKGDLKTWRRAKAVLSYWGGTRVIDIAEQLDVTRGSVNRWLQLFNSEGTAGLKPRKAAGPTPRLSEEQLSELTTIIECGPQGAGYTSGVWTGPMIGDLIYRRYGVRYHKKKSTSLWRSSPIRRRGKFLARRDASQNVGPYWMSAAC